MVAHLAGEDTDDDDFHDAMDDKAEIEAAALATEAIDSLLNW